MRFPRPVLFGAALVASVALVACGSDKLEPTPPVFVGPPWQGPESFSYNLLQRGVENDATCLLKTEPGADGRTTLSRLCSDKRGNKDDGVAIVQSETLAPVQSTRTTFDAERNRTTVHSVFYEDGQARFETRSGDKTRSTTRTLPEPNDKVPNPAWYDDESILWLVRGITLQDGYKATYTHVINAGQPRVLEVDVEVQGAEQVTVPAGEFTAWRLRVGREGSVYTFWVDQQAPHVLVRARIEDSTYELRPPG